METEEGLTDAVFFKGFHVTDRETIQVAVGCCDEVEEKLVESP